MTTENRDHRGGRLVSTALLSATPLGERVARTQTRLDASMAATLGAAKQAAANLAAAARLADTDSPGWPAYGDGSRVMFGDVVALDGDDDPIPGRVVSTSRPRVYWPAANLTTPVDPATLTLLRRRPSAGLPGSTTWALSCMQAREDADAELAATARWMNAWLPIAEEFGLSGVKAEELGYVGKRWAVLGRDERSWHAGFVDDPLPAATQRTGAQLVVDLETGRRYRVEREEIVSVPGLPGSFPGDESPGCFIGFGRKHGEFAAYEALESYARLHESSPVRERGWTVHVWVRGGNQFTGELLEVNEDAGTLTLRLAPDGSSDLVLDIWREIRRIALV
jgi:hypothetical protein